jgi:hypothetical protein
MFERTRAVPCLTGMALAALAACGGGSDPVVQPTPAPTPTPCTQTSLVQDSGGLPGRTLVYDDFSVPDSGRLDVTMDWTFATSQMGFYLVPANTCTIEEFNARTCNFVIRSETTTKPRKISTPNFTAGNYRWMVGNFSEDQESVSLQIVLSKGSCAPLAGGAPSASSRTDEAWPALERARHR